MECYFSDIYLCVTYCRDVYRHIVNNNNNIIQGWNKLKCNYFSSRLVPLSEVSQIIWAGWEEPCRPQNCQTEISRQWNISHRSLLWTTWPAGEKRGLTGGGVSCRKTTQEEEDRPHSYKCVAAALAQPAVMRLTASATARLALADVPWKTTVTSLALLRKPSWHSCLPWASGCDVLQSPGITWCEDRPVFNVELCMRREDRVGERKTGWEKDREWEV